MLEYRNPAVHPARSDDINETYLEKGFEGEID
jgi:hypothetical protein